MQTRPTQLGPLETQLLAWVQLKERSLVRAGEVGRVFGLTPKNEAKLFSRLCRRQLALRLMNGLYLLPAKIPPGGVWGPDPYWVLAQFMTAVEADYQVTGAAAFHRFGFTEQVANQIAVYNTGLSGRRKIGGMSYEFIKVAANRIGGVESLELGKGVVIPFSSAGRTLMDAVYDWSRFGSIPRVYEWIRSRGDDRNLVRQLVQAAIEFGNVGTVRRIGYVLEGAGVSRQRLRSLRDLLDETTSYVSLDPTRPKRGKVNKAWGLLINEP